MSVCINHISPTALRELISQKIAPTVDADGLIKFQRVMAFTTMVWGGSADGELKCIWGLVPPTLLSDEAYLWLHIIESIEEYEFVFVRYSQRAVEKALQLFPRIVGHCEVGEDRSIRWIKWLGGKFGEPCERMVPFVIEKR